MRAICAGLVAVGLLGGAVLVVAGCAGRRIDAGVFYSTKGYRVRIPSPEWTVVDDSRADLELRTRGGQAGILANATCEPEVARRTPGILQRHLFVGLRTRRVVEQADVSVAGRAGRRTVVEARIADDAAPVRIETVTLTHAGCVYDLIYAAPLEVFSQHRSDFDQFVASFVMER